jgi:pilus assembly protein CpaB
MRAISLKSDEIVGVSGFLFPGSHVDVLVTYRNPNSPDPVTATVLQNVEVLAAGSKIAADPDGKPAKVDEVTLLLSPVDAGKAVLASSQGTIHFVLRNGSDSAQEQDTTVGMAMLGGAAAVKEVTKVPHAPIYRKTVDQASVITVSGDKSAVSNFSTTK